MNVFHIVQNTIECCNVILFTTQQNTHFFHLLHVVAYRPFDLASKNQKPCPPDRLKVRLI